MGLHLTRERQTTNTSCSSEPKRGIFKSVVIRDDKVVGATLVGDTKQGRVPDQQAFDRGLPPAGRSGSSLLFDLGGPAEEVGAGRARRRHPDLQLQRGEQGSRSC